MKFLNKMKSSGYLVFVVLIFLLIVFAFDLKSYVCDSLQMDFSAYYTAGRDFLLGNDIYKNNILSPLSNWDGVSRYEHSRYIYFPVFSLVFVPFSLFPYRIAKIIWTVLSFFSLIASLFLILRHLSPTQSRKKNALIFSMLFMTIFYPVKTVLERGQVEPFLLLLIVVSLILINKQENSFIGGAVFSVAALMKFQLFVFLPFFILVGKKNAVAGMFAGILFINLIALIMLGREDMEKYYLKELPRIVQYGESGTVEMLLKDQKFENRLKELHYGISAKDGRYYKTSGIQLYSNASLTKAVSKRIPLSSNYVLLFFCTVVFFIAGYFQFKKQHLLKLMKNKNKYWEFWLGMLLFAVSVSPISWTMSLVWLLPLFVVFMIDEDISIFRTDYLLVFIGFILIAFPDSWLLEIQNSTIAKIVEGKYLYGEILILAGLFIRFVKWEERNYGNT